MHSIINTLCGSELGVCLFTWRKNNLSLWGFTTCASLISILELEVTSVVLQDFVSISILELEVTSVVLQDFISISGSCSSIPHVNIFRELEMPHIKA